jgi:hypothetical protein
MIDLARVGTGSNANFQYINVNTFSSVGASLTVEYRTIPYQISLGYSYTGRRNELLGYNQTANYYFSNEWRLNAAYNFVKEGLSINLFCKLNGKLQMYQYDYLKNEVALNFIDPYALVDLTTSKSFINKKLAVNFGFKNLLNVVNVNASFSSGPHSAGSNSAATSMGRSVFVGLKYNLI